MIFAALNEAADHGELLLVAGGLCRFHRRRDGTVTLRELLVLPECRRQGIGRSLVEAVVHRHPGARLLARCPVSYASNGFWPKVGFRLLHGTEGVNVWARPD